jgi:hypothetical protein
MNFFFTRLFPWPFVIIGALTLYRGGLSVYRAPRSLSWPMAEGRIENSSVERSSVDEGDTYHARILYTFTVAGQTHRGNRVAFGDYGTSDTSHAQGIVDRYPQDKVVQVRYLASDPDVCVLEPGLQAQAWGLPAFGLIFLSAGGVMLVFLPKLMKKQQAEPPPSQAPSGGSEARARH